MPFLLREDGVQWIEAAGLVALVVEGEEGYRSRLLVEVEVARSRKVRSVLGIWSCFQE
jgi:hypothetical protein